MLRHLRRARPRIFIVILLWAGIDASIAYCSEKQRDTAACLYTLLKRMSPDSAAISLPSHYEQIRRLNEAENALLKPEYAGQTENLGELQFSVRTVDAFFTKEFPTLNKKGFFLLFIPSGAEAPAKVGHMMVIAEDALFDRNMDGTAESLRSIPVANLPDLAKHFPYAIVQFFEVSPESEKIVSRFFHDRTWNYHAGDPHYQTHYVNRPLTTDAEAGGENCSTYALSFLCDRWTHGRPELARVKEEFGSVMLNQIPSRQIYHNTHVPSYRGTFLLGANPQEMVKKLMEDGARNDPGLSQIMMSGSVKSMDTR